MVKSPPLCRFLLLSGLAVSAAHAQQLTSTELASANPTPNVPAARGAADAAIFNQRNARTITLKIPAPRGQIVDREGEPLAQNMVVYQVALKFRQFENADRDFVINWARSQIDVLQPLVKNLIPRTDDELYDHYRDRRWLPLYVSGQISEKDARAIESKLSTGLTLQPVYKRYYPEGELAAHLIGYTGSVGKLPTGPINFNEPMWEESEGRAGFEKLFNEQLTGEGGTMKLLFDENGNMLLNEEVSRPRPGGTLVTTLDLGWQKLAEETLRKGCRRGAFVVIDVVTGEVLVMASRPSFDLNVFIPGISETDFKALNEDPAAPLHGRAFQSVYPPASSFKPVVAMAALNNETVTENSTIYCPASLTIGNTVMHNWSKSPEGSIDVKRALARSCNTWFYQVGIDVGPTAFLGLARRLGFGSNSGLPLIGEEAGIVPSDDYMLRKHRRRILNGDTANMSIGQGDLLASPLQVAQSMAGIANGDILPKLKLVRQIQDTRGRVVQMINLERREWLGVKKNAVDVVHKGMSDVVNGSGGTGHSAQLSYTTLCGKTGTAQWGDPRKNQRLAWFAGFLPEDNPRYAFAVLYEGRPGETVSGGRMAAPMVRRFFEGIKDDIKDTIAPPKKALIVVDETEKPAEGEAADAAAPEAEGFTRPRGNDAPLKALPVEPLDTGRDEEEPADEEPAEPAPARAARAIPVGEDEVIENGIEEP